MTERALLFTDVVDSTHLVQRLGDAAAASLWAAHDRMARDLLARHGGREIDRSDGFFLLFEAPLAAALFALDYRAGLEPLGLTARVGVHVGDVTLRENAPDALALGAKPLEVDGLAKPFTARLMALAAGGQILLSGSARAALGDALPEGATVESHGHYRLKGVDEPAPVFELRRPGGPAFPPPADSEKAYRVIRVDDLWQPRSAVVNNLAPERDTFIGRAAELHQLAQCFEQGARLVTLLGVGGIGKTRLARRYGRAWLGDWPGGVYFCDLSDAHGQEGVCSVVAGVLGVPLGKDDPAVQLGHAIAGRGRCLLVLDNFEQLVAHAPSTVGAWLDRTDGARFLVTTRELLRLAGEQVLPVDPLDVGSEAVDLFEARARARLPRLVPDDGWRAAAKELVALLDGLPLAIELAAARVGILTPAQIVQRMKDRFGLLGGARGPNGRQATLRATIDWSWDLLADWERSALAQCSVFEGGFTLMAAEQVLDLGEWPQAPPVMDVVQALADKSLLRIGQPAAAQAVDIVEPRFGMYLSIHDYAAGKLDQAAAEAAHGRHGRCYAQLGTDQAIDALSQHGGTDRRRSLALEIDNLVAACRRAMARQAVDVAVATYRAIWQVLDLQGPVSLAGELGSKLLALGRMTPALRSEVGAIRGRAWSSAGLPAEAVASIEQALEVARSTQDRRLQLIVLTHLGNVLNDAGQVPRARTCLESARTLAADLGDRLAEGGILGSLGALHLRQRQRDPAQACLERALSIQRACGDRIREGVSIGNLAILHQEQGRFDDALVEYQKALAIHREVGNRRREGSDLGNLGNLHLERGRFAEAQTHLEAALAIHRQVGNRRSEGIVLSNMGNLQLAQGNIEQGRALYEAAVAIAEQVGNTQHQVTMLGTLGDVHRLSDDIAKAMSCYERALAVARATDARFHEGFILGCCLADMHIDAHRVDDALAACRAGEPLLRASGDALVVAKFLCIRGKVDIAVGDLASARAALAEAEATAASLGSGTESQLGQDILRLREALGRVGASR